MSGYRHWNRPRAIRAPLETVELDPQLASADYIDVFELEKTEPDERSPEELTRSAFDAVPTWWRIGIAWAHSHLLRFRLASHDEANQLLGWHIAESSSTTLRLEAAGSLMHGFLLVARVGPTRAQLTTALVFQRPLLARVVWAAVGPVHRRAAPALMERALPPQP